MTNVGILPKDVYLMITNYASDKDIINMLSVNKTYNDSIFSLRILTKKYPALIKLKKEKESWKTFYLRMIYYLSLLKEKYDIDYINIPSFDPIFLYKKLLSGFSKFLLLSMYVGETGDKNKIEDFLKGIGNVKNIYRYVILNGIAKTGNLKLYQEYEIYSKGFNHLFLIRSAMLSKNPEMIEYVSNKVRLLHDKSITDVLEVQMEGAILLDDISSFKFYAEQLKLHVPLEDLKDSFLHHVFEGKSFLMVKYFIDNNLLDPITILNDLFSFVSLAHTDKDLEIIKYLFSHLDTEYKQRFLRKISQRVSRKIIDKDIVSYLMSVK